ncbi:MAG: NrdH-redoxin [Dehalococcoidia bacterium]|nr:NrdH-redoxin [Dehalococcoidia bacterium]
MSVFERREHISKPVIDVYGAYWCPDTLRSLRLLDSMGIPYNWHDVDEDAAARAWVENKNNGQCRIPTIMFAEDAMLVEPSDAELEKKLAEIN